MKYRQVVGYKTNTQKSFVFRSYQQLIRGKVFKETFAVARNTIRFQEYI